MCLYVRVNENINKNERKTREKEKKTGIYKQIKDKAKLFQIDREGERRATNENRIKGGGKTREKTKTWNK